MANLDLVCGSCGGSLDYRPGEDGMQGNTYIVTICGICNNYDTGYDDGYRDGDSKGYYEGLAQGESRCNCE